jgi:hypothetical protein
MTLRAELSKVSKDHFVVLILDNEVTVGHFVARPPLPWTRLIQQNGNYQTDEGYPSLLTAELAKGETRNWDEVSLPAIVSALRDLDESADFVLIGNNAAQGFPLAESLPQSLIAGRAAIIYGDSLPEKRDYEKIGYRAFFRRSEAIVRVLKLAEIAGRPPVLFFINTIQHNESNYHDP